jgi:GNAT superfamily N-acetyltransferase
VRFEWPQTLSDRDTHDMVELMNAVAVRETTLGYSEPLDLETGAAMMRQLEVDIQREVVHVMVARDEDERIIGMLTLAPVQLPARRHIVEMRRCTIAPAHRGKFLIAGWQLALAKTQELGCDMIIIDVRSDGPADQLWRRLGFKEYGRLDDYARKNGRSITGYFLYAYVADVLEHYREYGTWYYDDVRLAAAQPVG